MGKDGPAVQAVSEDVKAVESDLIEDLAGSEFVKENILNEEPEKKEVPAKEEVEEEEIEEEEEEQEEPDEEEESEESGEAEEEIEEEEEEVIAKSKVDKRIAQLTAKLRAEEIKNERLQRDSNKDKDPDMVKLEAMSESELESTLDNIEAAKIKAVRDEDDSQLRSLQSLTKKVNKALRTAPDRFNQVVADNYEDAKQQILNDPIASNMTKEQGNAVHEDAIAIYQRTKSLQNTETGQAEALILAFERFKSDFSSGKSKSAKVNKEAQRKINSLKKKTSLAKKGQKGNISRQNLKTLGAKAKSGDFDNKLDFAKESGLLGDITKLVE